VDRVVALRLYDSAALTSSNWGSGLDGKPWPSDWEQADTYMLCLACVFLFSAGLKRYKFMAFGQLLPVCIYIMGIDRWVVCWRQVTGGCFYKLSKLSVHVLKAKCEGWRASGGFSGTDNLGDQMVILHAITSPGLKSTCFVYLRFCSSIRDLPWPVFLRIMLAAAL
jgi:hypothetical protein